jgi:hypothetical protein
MVQDARSLAYVASKGTHLFALLGCLTFLVARNHGFHKLQFDCWELLGLAGKQKGGFVERSFCQLWGVDDGVVYGQTDKDMVRRVKTKQYKQSSQKYLL